VYRCSKQSGLVSTKKDERRVEDPVLSGGMKRREKNAQSQLSLRKRPKGKKDRGSREKWSGLGQTKGGGREEKEENQICLQRSFGKSERGWEPKKSQSSDKGTGGRTSPHQSSIHTNTSPSRTEKKGGHQKEIGFRS